MSTSIKMINKISLQERGYRIVCEEVIVIEVVVAAVAAVVVAVAVVVGWCARKC